MNRDRAFVSLFLRPVRDMCSAKTQFFNYLKVSYRLAKISVEQIRILCKNYRSGKLNI